MNRIPFSEPDHPFSPQVMYAENPPFPLDPAHPQAGNRWGYVNMGFGVRKFPRVEDGVTFSDDELDYRGLPNMTIEYALTEREDAEIAAGDRAPAPRRAARSARSSPSRGCCRTVRACTTWARCAPAPTTTARRSPTRTRGCGASTTSSSAATRLIPTANTMNPTLTSVAIAVRGARHLAEELRGGGTAEAEVVAEAVGA